MDINTGLAPAAPPPTILAATTAQIIRHLTTNPPTNPQNITFHKKKAPFNAPYIHGFQLQSQIDHSGCQLTLIVLFDVFHSQRTIR
jgi:hypothetical protein